ncbi:hypothetical protein N665_0705s0014 [Sinapis alba]|nr:hypothetical protein N665_0705s0014 [Sinapis alba]
MEEELKIFILVWFSAIISVTYCYYCTPKIKTRLLRLVCVLPVCAFFLNLLIVFLSGLEVAKLILFAFEKGPLFLVPPNAFHFICFACLPIKLQKNPNPENRNHFPKWVFSLKFSSSIALTLIKYLVTVTLGCDLEPQFNEPYLATSLHNFWGHRWNLMISEILRMSVYLPIRKWRVNSSEWDMLLGISATFLVSGLAHEILFFYLMREKPTWEVIWFFVLHGVCTASEVVRKTKVEQRWLLNPTVSRLLTVGFVFVTGVWLSSPEPIRNGLMERFTNEGLFFINLCKRKLLRV